jgi:hypothetical protein
MTSTIRIADFSPLSTGFLLLPAPMLPQLAGAHHALAVRARPEDFLFAFVVLPQRLQRAAEF